MVRCQAQECPRPAAVFDAALVHDVAERSNFVKNLAPRLGGEPAQINLDRAELDRLIGAVEQ